MTVSVVISNNSRATDKMYTYLVAPNDELRIKTGMRVKVPFGKSNKLYEAYVMRVNTNFDKSDSLLKCVESILEDYSYFNDNTVSLIEFMKHRYFCTYISAIKTIVPTGVNKKFNTVYSLSDTKPDTVEKFKEICIHSAVQTAVLNFFEQNSEGTSLQIADFTGRKNLSAALKDMVLKGVLNKKDVESDGLKDTLLTYVLLAVSVDDAYIYTDYALKRAKAQAAVVETVCSFGGCIELKELLQITGTSKPVVGELVKKGILVFEKRSHFGSVADKPIEISNSRPILTDEQQVVVSEVGKAIDNQKNEVFVLHGVTGSGKTEVYLNLIEHAAKLNRQSVFLVPEIALTPQMVNLVVSRFGNDVAVLHSNLTLKQRYDEWKNIKNGKIKVVVGARSAIFAPFDNIGFIIVDEEHENTYKSETSPRYQTGEIARFRAKQSDAVVLLASATPSIESYYNAKKGKFRLLEMTKRPNNSCLPQVDIVDMRCEIDEGNMSIFSHRLQDEINENIKNHKQTILFINKRGFSSFVSCRKCGYVMQCPNCNVSLTYHKSINKMVCHYCDYMQNVVSICPSCGSKHIKYFGTGTQKVTDEIQKCFPNATYLRMDADTTAGRMKHEEILNEFKNKHIDILVGTQMITKGLDIENVTLVGILAADMSLNMDDYRAGERTFDLITQVSGRAGRGKWKGRSVIQTYNPENETIIQSSKQDYKSFYNSEILFRESLTYPPFCEFINILFTDAEYAKAKNTAIRFETKLKQIIKNNNFENKIMLYKPCEAPLYKINGKFRYRMLAKTVYSKKLYTELHNLYDRFLADKKSSSIIIDVNPQSMI